MDEKSASVEKPPGAFEVCVPYLDRIRTVGVNGKVYSWEPIEGPAKITFDPIKRQLTIES